MNCLFVSRPATAPIPEVNQFHGLRSTPDRPRRCFARETFENIPPLGIIKASKSFLTPDHVSLKPHSRIVRFVTALTVMAWLAVCGQSCAEADIGPAGERTLAGTAHAGNEGNAPPAGGIVLHAPSRHAPRHGGNDPGCNAGGCCAKIAMSDHGKQAVPAGLQPPLAAATLLYTLSVTAVSHLAAPASHPKPLPELTPLQVTGILRI